MGVVAEDCGASKEFMVECECCMPLVDDSVVVRENVGGGRYA